MATEDRVVKLSNREFTDAEYAAMQVEETAFQPFVELQPVLQDDYVVLPVGNLWAGAESSVDTGYGKLKSGTSSKMAEFGYILLVAILYVGDSPDNPGPIPEGSISWEHYETLLTKFATLQAKMQLQYQKSLTAEANF